MATIEWSAPGREDLLAIISYISNENPKAAQRIKNEIEAKVNGLSSNPRRHKRGREAGTHEMVVHPNYIVVYRENTAKVSILRILHTARQWPAAD